ncbi:magnesium transporter, partial [Rhizobium ruizarguesonis]
DEHGQMLCIVTVDDVIDTMIADTTEAAQRFCVMEALGQPYMKISFACMIRKRAGWLAALFLGEMLTASAMQHFEGELEKAVVLT